MGVFVGSSIAAGTSVGAGKGVSVGRAVGSWVGVSVAVGVGVSLGIDVGGMAGLEFADEAPREEAVGASFSGGNVAQVVIERMLVGADFA